MSRKLILVYQTKRVSKELDGTMEYFYPEDTKNPRECFEWAKSLYPYNLDEDLTVVTWSPFVAESVIKALEPHEDMKLVLMVDDKIATSDEFFGQWASVMREIFSVNL